MVTGLITQYRNLIYLILLCGSLQSCGSRVELFSGISENEANDALAILINAGIPSTKISGKEGLVNIDIDSLEERTIQRNGNHYDSDINEQESDN